MKTGPDDWEWLHERMSALLARDGWMCETHPGKAFPHDDCPGPGIPWHIEGRAAIEASQARIRELEAALRDRDGVLEFCNLRARIRELEERVDELVQERDRLYDENKRLRERTQP